MTYYKNHSTGKFIDEQTYNRLTFSQKMKFSRYYGATPSRSSIIDTALDIGLGMAIGSFFDGGNDSSSSNSSFDGFDGGDFGGGGGGADW